MLFAYSSSKEDFVVTLYPDTLICSPSKSCTGIQKWLRASLYRDRCAAAFDLNPLPGFDSGRPKLCTAKAPSAEENLYPDMQKPRHASLITALVDLSSLPGYVSPLPFDSATFTNAYRRAVSIHSEGETAPASPKNWRLAHLLLIK
jgi:hypothetical protein